MPMTTNEFLRDVLTAIEALPEHRLARGEFYDPSQGTYCALGAWLKAKGYDAAKEELMDICVSNALQLCCREYDLESVLLSHKISRLNDACYSLPGGPAMTGHKRWRIVRQWLRLALEGQAPSDVIEFAEEMTWHDE